MINRIGWIGWVASAPLGILNYWLYGGGGWLIAGAAAGLLAVLIALAKELGDG